MFTLQSSAFWETYVKGRPVFPQSFSSRIFTYHDSHDGEFHIINDLGCGVGVNSPALAERFEHVVLTDPGSLNLEIARQHVSEPQTKNLESGSASLNTATLANQSSYVLGSAEDNPIPAASLDMVLVSNSIHHADSVKSIAKITEQLKQGGTMVIVLAGIPSFSDSRVREIWGQMATHAISCVRRKYEQSTKTQVPRMLEMLDSGYDSIAIPYRLFENVKRMKLNTRGITDEPCRLASGERYQYPLISNFGPNDEATEEHDND